MRLRIALVMALVLLCGLAQAERRDERFRIKIPAYRAFYEDYNPLYRMGALANYWNLHTYDEQMTHPGNIDGGYYERMRSKALGSRIRLETDLETASPLFARLAWDVGQSFMWTHALHENAFDAYADSGLSMDQRWHMVERATDEYLKDPRAISPVPVSMEIIQRLPYHGAFARRYPKMTGLIWAGHWFHAGVYEAQLAVLAGRQTRQGAIRSVEAEFERLVQNPPAEHPHFTHFAPDFTRMHPRAANIFGNMHMLHDMVADILADDSITDKRQAIVEARNMMLASRTTEGGQGHAH